MDQASASPAASCAHNPAAPRTSSSCSQSADQSQTVGPPPARSSPRSEPHSEPVHIVPRPSSPALCQSDAKGYLLPDFYSGCATGIPGRLTEGLLLWRSHSYREIHEKPMRWCSADMMTLVAALGGSGAVSCPMVDQMDGYPLRHTN